MLLKQYIVKTLSKISLHLIPTLMKQIMLFFIVGPNMIIELHEPIRCKNIVSYFEITPCSSITLISNGYIRFCDMIPLLRFCPYIFSSLRPMFDKITTLLVSLYLILTINLLGDYYSYSYE